MHLFFVILSALLLTAAHAAAEAPVPAGDTIRYSLIKNQKDIVARHAKIIPAPEFGADSVKIISQAQNDPYALLTFPKSLKALESYPGVTIALDPSWDLTGYQTLSLKVTNLDNYGNIVRLRLDSECENGESSAARTAWIAPGETRVLSIQLNSMDNMNKEVLIPKVTGVPAWAQQATVNTGKITALLISLDNPKFAHEVIIHEITVDGKRINDTPEKILPFIDQFGQYVHLDWPQKIHTAADFQKHLELERQDLAAHPPLIGLDQYGGWTAGPQLKATGFFRVEKYQGKWFLITPEGHLFFSHGPQTVDLWQATMVEDGQNPQRSQWFAPPPDKRFNFAIPSFPDTRWYDYSSANLFQKYGKDYKNAFFDITHKRLASWGQNSIGNTSNMTLCEQNKTPFFVKAVPEPQCPVLAGDKFYDVFDPDFARKLEDGIKRRALPYANNPWCAGFFVDNELRWGMDENKLVLEVLNSPDSASKREFVGDLQKKYRTIKKLNAQWDTRYRSFEDLQSSTVTPDPEKARQDFKTFYTKFAEKYFNLCKQQLKAAVPNHLYLGARFSNTGSNQTVVRVAAKYCDVLSINNYTPTVRNYFHDKDLEDLQGPILLSEFHFGAPDRGLFNAGIGPAANDQKERAAMYKRYVLEVLGDPRFVGCHYFQYRDQPLVGDVHKESGQIGFVDVADTPYPEIIQASREIAETMYQYRLDQKNGKK